MKFRLRQHDPRMFLGTPGSRVLEITRGNATESFALTSEDLAALSALTFYANAGAPMPIVTGTP